MDQEFAFLFLSNTGYWRESRVVVLGLKREDDITKMIFLLFSQCG